MSATTMTTTTDAQLSFRRPSGGRTIKNALATVYVFLAAALAIIPLAWVLYSVITKGIRLILTPEWWLQSQRGITPRREGGGAYHAALPTMINAGRDQAPQLPGYERVWAAALTLILISMLLNLLARVIARASKLKEK
jgi:ABC-type phosphate transport system permease subunit